MNISKGFLAILGLGLTGASFLVDAAKDAQNEKERDAKMYKQIDAAVEQKVDEAIKAKTNMITIINGGKSEP